MPELPDITIYLEALQERIVGAHLERVRLLSPFLLRTADPPLASVEGKTVSGLQRIGKRIVVGSDRCRSAAAAIGLRDPCGARGNLAAPKALQLRLNGGLQFGGKGRRDKSGGHRSSGVA